MTHARRGRHRRPVEHYASAGRPFLGRQETQINLKCHENTRTNITGLHRLASEEHDMKKEPLQNNMSRTSATIERIRQWQRLLTSRHETWNNNHKPKKGELHWLLPCIGKFIYFEFQTWKLERNAHSISLWINGIVRQSSILIVITCDLSSKPYSCCRTSMVCLSYSIFSY